MTTFEEIYPQGNLPYACFQRGDRYVIGAIMNNGDYFWMFKTDLNGNLVSTKTYITPPGGEFMADVVATSDGGYLLLGHSFGFPLHGSYFFGYAVKVDSNLNKQWEFVNYDDTDSISYNVNEFLGGAETEDGEFILLAQTLRGTSIEAGTNANMMLVKLNPSGEKQWEKILEYPGYTTIRGGIAVALDGYLIAASQSFIYTENDSIVTTGLRPFLIKTDFDGDTLWTKRYDRPDLAISDSYWFEGILPLSDGNYLPCGYTNLKINKDGQEIWQSSTLLARNNMSDGSIICCSGHFVSKISENGQVLWTKEYFTEPQYNYPYHYYFKDIIETNDGGFFAVVQYTGYMLLLKMDCEGNYLSTTCFSTAVNPAAVKPEITLSPNPTQDNLTITFPETGTYQIQITDIQGKACYTQSFFGEKAQFSVDFLPAGLYLITLESKETGKIMGKFVKE